ncbi:MAG TPA: ferredoxin reductase [Solirubrobacteraceae bacterium]|nr:ferredoxin reductase [Solirubrobacteraceae bacterium]
MAERGAVPQVPALRRQALRLVRSFTFPLAPDDYLELVDPLWSTRELKGRVVGVAPASADAVTVLIKPGWEWPGHRAGQYLRLGVAVDGRHHWRAYSLTSEPARPDGCISITPKLVPGGRVSPFLCERLEPGAIVRLGGVEGTFTLPEPTPERLLFVSAGSGITPIVSMVRELACRGTLAGESAVVGRRALANGGAPAGGQARADGRCDVVHIHSSREPGQIAFAGELRGLAARNAGYGLHAWISGERGRLEPADLDGLCPDWRSRETFLCGPPDLLEAFEEHWREEGIPERLHVERFGPGGRLDESALGEGGTIRFCKSGVEAVSDGREPILAAGESAGAALPFGCRMGICHSCVGRLRSGRVRDLRTGDVFGQDGELVQTCINAPEGPVEIEL